jgi:hypothetical protein
MFPDAHGTDGTGVNILRTLFFLMALFLNCLILKGQFDKINLSTPKHSITNLSAIATDIEYIPLETTPNSLMGRIIHLKAIGNFIYASTVDSKLFCFERTGKYKFCLDQAGNGPGEYQFITEFAVNDSNTLLAIIGRSKEIMLYRQTGGSFIHQASIKLSHSAFTIDFCKNSDNILLQYSNTSGINPHSKEVINIKGESLKYWPNHMRYNINAKMHVVTRYENTSYRLGDDIILKEVGNDTIFRFTRNQQLRPFMIFDSKNKRVTPELRADIKYYAEHLNEYFILQKFFGSERYLYYTALMIEGAVIYDKLKKIKFNVPEKGLLKDDIAGGVDFEPMYCRDGFFYSWVDAIKIKTSASTEQVKKSKALNPDSYSAYMSLTKRISENDNPVIIMVKIQ